jgi:hypothetical protein
MRSGSQRRPGVAGLTVMAVTQAKQAPGWRLEQPEPGLLNWTLPSGRRYTVAPEPYPA